jgi:hypothetical protein
MSLITNPDLPRRGERSISETAVLEVTTSIATVIEFEV